MASATDEELFTIYVERRTTLGNLSKKSAKKYRAALRTFLAELHRAERTLATMDEHDALALIRHLREFKNQYGNLCSEETRAEYWQIWKGFLQYAYEHIPLDHRAYTAHMGYQYRVNKNRQRKKSLFTSEEMRLIRAAETSYSWLVFWEAFCSIGPRISEFLGNRSRGEIGVRVRDVAIHEDATISIHIPSGKTGPRTVFLVGEPADIIARWALLHPHRTKPDAPFFLNERLSPISHAAAEQRLKKLAVAAGLHKERPCLHGIRMSAATRDANHMSDAVLCKKYGWTPGSPMPQRYVRQSGIDLKEAELRAQSARHP